MSRLMLRRLGVFAGRRKCLSCDSDLAGSEVLAYPHRGGMMVNGERLWVFVECMKCMYQNSWVKLGIDSINSIPIYPSTNTYYTAG